MSNIFNQLTPQQNGMILLIAGIIIRYIIARRKFNRRGIGGLEHFSNYFTAINILFLEWLFKWAANGILLWGLFGLLFR